MSIYAPFPKFPSILFNFSCKLYIKWEVITILNKAMKILLSIIIILSIISISYLYYVNHIIPDEFIRAFLLKRFNTDCNSIEEYISYRNDNISKNLLNQILDNNDEVPIYDYYKDNNIKSILLDYSIVDKNRIYGKIIYNVNALTEITSYVNPDFQIQALYTFKFELGKKTWNSYQFENIETNYEILYQKNSPTTHEHDSHTIEHQH